ncbi:MAG: FdhF/YdeP family oxidoreductase [Candidatus Poribacteria bacterium]|nr:FdhF/YdeP family oxidoreductase [Candidatus Poribacteria bacterium]
MRAPFGLGQQKPKHFREMARVAWENRGRWGYARRILTQGVCDGCALGTTGVRDFTLPGIHLCMVRLELLKLNTQGAFKPDVLKDAEALERLSGKELRALGRIPYPFVREKGDQGFRRVSWEEALERAGRAVRSAVERDPRRLAVYLTSRGLTNETYYAAQKAARFLGTNNVDTSARICHAPSAAALKSALGYAASTCSYRDWIGTDLLVFFGSNTPNNQPVTLKYIHEAKKKGTRVVVVNPYEEPGFKRYWIPSSAGSALAGSQMADAFYRVHTGGDLAFLTGALKYVLAENLQDADFIARRTDGFEATRAHVESQSWESLERGSGASRADMERFGELVGRAETAVFVWSMGITQHRNGTDNVRAIANLALSRGFVGREKCGLVPIRGHSGVQGGAEVGAVPNAYAMNRPINEEQAGALAEIWGFDPPLAQGLNAVQTLSAAARGEIDLLYSIGGNFLQTMPDPAYVEQGLARIPTRIHQDIVLSKQMLTPPSEEIILLPGKTRYEQDGGGTETSTERRIYFSPYIPGQTIGEAKSEWEIPLLIAQSAFPERKRLVHFESAQAIREEIARVVEPYAGIETLSKKGDAVQWGGERLGAERFNTPNGKAQFAVLETPEKSLAEGRYFLSSRRGKQFNSMKQREIDPLTGAARHDVLISKEDADALGLNDGDPILLKNEFGELRSRVKTAPILPRNLQAHWPECNVLLPREVGDPESGVPDYNATVQIVPLDAGG